MNWRYGFIGSRLMTRLAACLAVTSSIGAAQTPIRDVGLPVNDFVLLILKVSAI